MPFTPLISRVTLLALPTSVWIRMNALTTSASLDQGLGASYVKAPTRREPGVHVRGIRARAEGSGPTEGCPREADGAVGCPKSQPLVEAGRAVVGLGHPEDHRAGAPRPGPPEHLVDETSAHPAGPPGGVDPHPIQVRTALLPRARSDRHADPCPVVLHLG